jgi:hypothetical protein
MSKQEVIQKLEELENTKDYHTLALKVNYIRFYVRYGNLELKKNNMGYIIYVNDNDGMLLASIWEDDIINIDFEVIIK